MSDSFRAHSAGYLLNHIARQFALLLHERLKPLAVYSNPRKALYSVAPPRRTKLYCLRRRALSRTL